MSTLQNQITQSLDGLSDDSLSFIPAICAASRIKEYEYKL